MASNEGIQAFAQPVSTMKSVETNLDEQPSDVIRQYLAKKTAWVCPTEEQFDALVKSLKTRLNEGHGETILEIGTGGLSKLFFFLSFRF